MKRIPDSDLNHILDHTRDLWEELRGERIFLTGGTGFFGKWLLESLLWANDQLQLDCRTTILTRDPDKFKISAPLLAGHKIVTIVQGDVRTFDFPRGLYRYVIHAATESSTNLNVENPLQMLNTIIEGTRHSLEFAKSVHAQKFLLISSGAVYGKQPSDLTHMPENYMGAPDPLDPKSAYGEGKRVAEHLCSLYADTIFEPKIARGFAFVGPYLALDGHFAIGNFIRDVLNGNLITIKGNGTPRRSYLYMSDLAIWLWTILFRGEPLRPYNVGSESCLSVEDVAYEVAKVKNKPIKVEILGKQAPNQLIERYVPSTQRAKLELNLEETISLKEAIYRTFEFYRSTNDG